MEDRSGSASVLEELKTLDAQIDTVKQLDELKPIFYRLEEIHKEHANDFEVQLAVEDVKKHLMARGTRLKSNGGKTGSDQYTAQGSGQNPRIPTPPSGQQRVPNLATPGSQRVPTPGPHAMPVYVPPVRTQNRPAAPPGPPPVNWKKPVSIGAITGLVVFLAIAGMVSSARRKKQVVAAPAGAAPVEVNTHPPGASIRVNHQARCTSNCRIELVPGKYELTAVLPGYEPQASTVTVAPGRTLAVSLTLLPQPQSVRVNSDLSPGRILLDGRPAGELLDGELTIDRIREGRHTLAINGKGADVEVPFELKAGAAPLLTSNIKAKNISAIAVSTFGDRAHVWVPNAEAAKISVDNKPSGPELDHITAGSHDLVVMEGNNSRKYVVIATPNPALTVYANSDTSTGTLVVVTAEDEVTVFLNGRPRRGRTLHGQLRISNLPEKEYVIRVHKNGYQDVAEQKVQVKKGEEQRLVFAMKALPQVAALHIAGGTAGTQVLFDNQSLGRIQNDGSFSAANLPPGEHGIEFRREQFLPKKVTRNFKAGESIELAGADVVLEKMESTLMLDVSPVDAKLTIKRSDEAQSRSLTQNPVVLSPGSYTISGHAPGYTDGTVTVAVTAGESASAELHLTKKDTAPAPPKIAGGMDRWEKPEEWQSEGGWSVHKGGGFVLYHASPDLGTFTFTAQLLKGGFLRSKRVQWFFDYVDPKNYILFQLDRKNFRTRMMVNGKAAEKPKVDLEQEPGNSFTISAEVTPDSITHRVQHEGKWIVLDTLAEPGHQFGKGKFGFLIPGGDELGLSNFIHAR